MENTGAATLHLSRSAGDIVMRSLTVSMPAYNEAANIAAMVELVASRTADLTSDLEIIVVDDGS